MDKGGRKGYITERSGRICENSKEFPHSAHPNGMNEFLLQWPVIFCSLSHVSCPCYCPMMAAIYTVAGPDQSTNHIYVARMVSQHTNVVRKKDVFQNIRHLFLKAEVHATNMAILSPCIWNHTIPV